MIKIIPLFFIHFFIAGSLFSQSISDSTPLIQQLTIKTKIKDLGTLQKGEKSVYKFELTNTSTTSLVIWHVSTSCGCTSPSWTKKPVKSQETAEIKIKFEAEESGIFEKSVFVYTNFSDRPIKLSIRGQVLDTKSNKGFTKKETQFNSQLSK
jgi:hypothetical protein